MKLRENWIVLGLLGLFLLSVVLGGVKRNSDISLNLKPGVAVVDLVGMIEMSDAGLFPGGIDSVGDALEDLADVGMVKAVVLRVNSPGGHVGSSQELYDQVLRFQSETGKPVVVSIVDYGASGAYWVSLGAAKIVAHPGSLVGSMGVIAQTLDLTRVPDKYGVGVETFKAGRMKDMLNPWRKTGAAERNLMQGMLDDLHTQFIEVLKERRGFDELRARELADGRVFTGRQAKDLGLVDALGGLDLAVKLAGEAAGISGNPRVIRGSKRGVQRMFESVMGVFGPEFSLISNGLEIR